MKNNTQGFTLIELLIVIAIIGILAAVLIPNLLGAQKRAYDAGSQSCAKSLQTYLAIQLLDNQVYPAALPVTGDGINVNCSLATTKVTAYVPTAGTNYTFKVTDDRGARIYTATASDLTSVARP